MGRSLEELRDVLLLWFVAFKNRFDRELTNTELIEAIESRTKELEAQEIRTKFCGYTYQELSLVKDLINSELMPDKKQTKDSIFNNTFKSKKSHS